jgi:hypothetical protein
MILKLAHYRLMPDDEQQPNDDDIKKPKPGTGG